MVTAGYGKADLGSVPPLAFLLCASVSPSGIIFSQSLCEVGE